MWLTSTYIPFPQDVIDTYPVWEDEHNLWLYWVAESALEEQGRSIYTMHLAVANDGTVTWEVDEEEHPLAVWVRSTNGNEFITHVERNSDGTFTIYTFSSEE